MIYHVYALRIIVSQGTAAFSKEKDCNVLSNARRITIDSRLENAKKQS